MAPAAAVASEQQHHHPVVQQWLFDSAEFGSGKGDDYYFEPDDEVVWNPDKFSPHQRFRRFFGRRWHVASFHRGGGGNHNKGNTKVYLHAATANGRGVPPRHEDVLFSDSATSIARTSCSSVDNDVIHQQETKVGEYGDETCLD